MPRLTSPQFAFYFSLGLHLVAMTVLAWQPVSDVLRTDFAGQRKAISLAATFAQPVPLSEPEPVELVMSETDAEQSTIDVAPDATLSREAQDLLATVDKSDLKVETERKTPPAQRAQRRELKRQEKPVKPTERPLPRKQPPLLVVTSAAAPPIPTGTSQETPPDFTNNPAPSFPPEALRNGWTGEVLLRLTIGTDGRVTKVEVVRSSGYTILDEAAVDAIRQWKGTPARRDGEPVIVERILPVRFLR